MGARHTDPLRGLKPRNNTLANCWKSCIVFRSTAYQYTIWAPKSGFAKWWNSCTCASNVVYPCLTCPNMKCVKCRETCIRARLAVYLCSIWPGNLTIAKWRNSCISARSTAYLSILNIASKHDSSQVTKFVCLSPTDLLLLLPRNMSHTKCISTRHKTYCTEFGLKKYSLQMMEFLYWRSIYSPSKLNMQSKHDSHQVMNLIYWRSIRSLSVLNMSSKHDLRQVMNFLYCCSNNSLSVLNIASKHDSRQVMKFEYLRSVKIALKKIVYAYSFYTLEENLTHSWIMYSHSFCNDCPTWEFAADTYLLKLQRL
jgi:hypothetical protein